MCPRLEGDAESHLRGRARDLAEVDQLSYNNSVNLSRDLLKNSQRGRDRPPVRLGV